MFCHRRCRPSVVISASPKSFTFCAAISAYMASRSLGVAGRTEYFFIEQIVESIPYNRQLQAGLRRLIVGNGCFHIRAFPDVTGIVAAHIGKCWQNATRKAVQATVYADLPFERLAEILEQEVLADSGSDVFPREHFVCTTLAVGVENRIETVLFEGFQPCTVFFTFIPSVE